MAVTFDKIATTTIGGTASVVTFSSISGNYTDLVIVGNCRGAVADTLSIVKIRFNSDTGNNYSRTILYGTGSTVASGRVSNQNHIGLEYVIGNNGTASTFTPVIINIFNYANTTTYKTLVSRQSLSSDRVGTDVGLWRSTSAITSIELSETLGTNWATGSIFTLYGIKAF